MGKPAVPAVPPTMSALLAEAWTEFADRNVLEHSDGNGNWTGITGADALGRVRAIGKGLIATGLKPGDRVGIMSRTRLEWMMLDFGAWAAGLVPVPIYDTSSHEQVDWIISDSEISLLFVETSENAAMAKAVSKGQSPLKDIRVIDDGALDALAKAGQGITDEELERRSSLAKPGDLATVIYTSGTTGRPKGVVLSHYNFCRHAVGIREELNEVFKDDPRVLQFMTLAHVFARIIQVACLYAGATIGFTPDSRNLAADMKTFHPTLLVAVPRVFEKVYNSAEQKAAIGGKSKIFGWAVEQILAYSRAQDTAGGPSVGLKVKYKVADTLVGKKLREALGGRAKWAVSGGAPLGERLSHFYRGIGLTVLEGYGLTETTAASHVNRPAKVKIGTVGKPLQGVEVKVASDGEILMRGDIVFSGYYRNPEATSAAIVGGWFHTGDLGAEDADGYLTITGRKKEIIVTAGGKNVAPAVLEERIRSHALVSQCVVVGDARPFIGALVTIDSEGLSGWLKAQGAEDMTLAQAIESPLIKDAVAHAVADANAAVSRAESIREFRILPVDFTIMNGYLTPSMKVKREIVHRDFAEQIRSIYGN